MDLYNLKRYSWDKVFDQHVVMSVVTHDDDVIVGREKNLGSNDGDDKYITWLSFIIYLLLLLEKIGWVGNLVLWCICLILLLFIETSTSDHYLSKTALRVCVETIEYDLEAYDIIVMLLLLGCGGGDNGDGDSMWSDVWWDVVLIMLVSSQHGGNDTTKAKEYGD